MSTTLSQSLTPVVENLGLPYLQLQLEPQTSAVLPMKHAQEVFTLPSRRITPIPNMPDCILGLLNQRSRVFWTIDLPQLLGMQPIDRNLQQYQLAIMRFGKTPLGTIVHQVKGVIRLTPEEIQPAQGHVTANLLPYVEGCCLQPNQTLLVLNAEAIINSAVLHPASN